MKTSPLLAFAPSPGFSAPKLQPLPVTPPVLAPTPPPSTIPTWQAPQLWRAAPVIVLGYLLISNDTPVDYPCADPELQDIETQRRALETERDTLLRQTRWYDPQSYATIAPHLINLTNKIAALLQRELARLQELLQTIPSTIGRNDPRYAVRMGLEDRIQGLETMVSTPQPHARVAIQNTTGDDSTGAGTEPLGFEMISSDDPAFKEKLEAQFQRIQAQRDAQFATALLALQQSTSPMATALIKIMQLQSERDPQVETEAAQEVRDLGLEVALPALIQSLTYDNQYVRWAIIRLLGAIGVDVIPWLIAMQRGNPDATMRVSIAQSFAYMTDLPEIAVAALLQMLLDPHYSVRTAVFETLGADRIPTPKLVALAEDPALGLQRHAVEALGNKGDPVAIPVLTRLAQADLSDIPHDFFHLGILLKAKQLRTAAQAALEKLQQQDVYK